MASSFSSPSNNFPPAYSRRPETKPPLPKTRLNPTPLLPQQWTDSETKKTVKRGSGVSDAEEREIRERERKEEVNSKIASKKAISIILRREATKAVIEKKRGPTNSKKLLPRTVLEALHERITALRWESALQVVFYHQFF